MHRRLIVGLCSWLMLLGAAQAIPLLSQPLVLNDGRASHVANGTGFIVYDRIQLPQTSQIESLTWVGAFIDTANSANNPVANPATTWHFQVLDDALGNPGAVTDNATLSSASVVATLLGQGTLAGQPVNVYRFAATLVDPLLVVGGIDQWFTLFSENASADPRFGWFSDGNGVGLGDGVAKQLSLSSQTFSSQGDRALTLDGSHVPEPATLSLLALALVATARCSRRR